MNTDKGEKNGKKYKTFKEYLENEYTGPFCATDIIIRYNGGIVLIDRKYEPHGLALPGGIAEKMSFPKNAIKEAKEETGLDVVLDNEDRPFAVLSEIGQDPRAFIASICYTATGQGVLMPHEDEDASSAKVFTLDEIAGLLKQKNVFAFRHHKKILEKYLHEAGNFQ